MLLRTLPLAAGLLPIIGIHASYLIAIQYARLPACLPYFSGCTSVSATGRYPPSSFLFKAVMLPEAVLLILYWILCAHWLRALEPQSAGRKPAGARLILAGSLGAAALILYVTFLGTREPFYEFMRRFGIYVFFIATLLAQLELTLRIRRVALANQHQKLQGLGRVLVTLVILPFALGALNLFLKAVLDDPDLFENAIEWIVVLAMQTHISLTYFAWRATSFQAKLSAHLD
ncbi:MAG: hypothetical protein WBN23_11650 [Woeseia sp.]